MPIDSKDRMNKEEQKSINSNLNALATNTVHLEELLEALQKKQLIDVEERENILKLPTKYKRCSEIYLLLLRKGPDAFDALYQSLVETKNDTVAEILKPDESAHKRTYRSRAIRRSDSERDRQYGYKNRLPEKLQRPMSLTEVAQVEADIQITAANIKEIVDILENTIAHAEWPVIANDLLDISVRQELDKLPSSATYEEIFDKTLHLWINSRGSQATLNNLLLVLFKRKQYDTADELKNKHQKIFLTF